MNPTSLFAVHESAAVGLLVNTAAQGAALLLAASLAAWACRSAAASVRRQIWTAALTLALAMPGLALITPDLTTWQGSSAFGLSEAPRIEQSLPVAANAHSADAGGRSLAAPGAESSLPAEAPLDLAALQATFAASADVDGGEASGLVRPRTVLLAWLIGASLALLPVLTGIVSLARLRRNLRMADHPKITGAFQSLLRQLKLDRPRWGGLIGPPRLAICDERAIPMTWGLFRPIVVLPAEASTWNATLLRAVLTHELAHVARHDCLFRVIGQLSRAVHWFNPLAWWGVARLHAEQENVCDDHVLSSGVAGVDYADGLVSLLSDRPARRWTAAVALAVGRSTRLERRVAWILDDDRSRAPIGRRARAGLWAVTTGLAVLCSTVGWHAASGAPNDALVVAIDQLSEGSTIATTQFAAADQKDAEAPAEADAEESPAGLEQIKELIEKLSLSPADARKLEAAAIQGMLKELNDPYAEFLPAEALQAFERGVSSSFVGIGVQLEKVGEAIRVAAPLANSPAERAGVRSGDILLAVDDQALAGLELTDVVKRVAGPAGSKVRVKLRHDGGAEQELEIERASIAVPSLEGLRRTADGGWQHFFDDPNTVAYVRVNSFGQQTAEHLRALVQGLQAKGAKGLLLDLRGCPGGMLPAVIETAGLFMAKGPVVRVLQRGQDPMTLDSPQDQAACDLPMIVLIDDHTSSAAEVLSGALQDRGRAELLGDRTFGKGSVQSIVPLRGTGVKDPETKLHGAIKLSTARFTSPSGREIQRSPAVPEWGIDPAPKMRLPVTTEEQQDSVQRWRRFRAGVPTEAEQQAQSPLSADSVELDLRDRQLGAALRAMSAKLTAGEYPDVGIDEEAWRKHLEARRQAKP